MSYVYTVKQISGKITDKIKQKEKYGVFPVPPKMNNNKSQELTKEERRWLRGFIRRAKTLQAAGKALCIPRSTLDSITIKGSGSPENVGKIRGAFNQPVEA